MTEIYRYYFELPDLQTGFYPAMHIKAIAAGLICAAAGSLQAVLRVLRLEPAAAMRPEPPEKGRRVLLEQLQWLWRHLSAPWRLAVRSLSRQRYRTSAGVFASAMGAGLLVTGLMMLESQTFLIDFEFFRVVRSDIDLMFERIVDKQAMNELRRLPGVVLAEPTLNLTCRLFAYTHYTRCDLSSKDSLIF